LIGCDKEIENTLNRFGFDVNTFSDRIGNKIKNLKLQEKCANIFEENETLQVQVTVRNKAK
jgi:hypothetical protein